MLKLKKGLILILLLLMGYFSICFSQEPDKLSPIVVNGDKVEYFTELNMIVAEGNVIIEYGEETLYCDKITVFTQTRDILAEGNVRLKDESGIVDGSSAFYNLDTKQGKIIEADMKMAPYFTVAPEAEKFPAKFILYDADITTCNLDKPHYHLHCRRVEIIPNDKIRAKKVKFVVGNRTIMYLPFFVQSIKDRREGSSFSLGQSKEWGPYVLSRYTYYLTDDVRGTMHFDWRENKGFGGGMDLEMLSENFGRGLFRYYQVNEHLRAEGEVSPIFKNTVRYKTQYRHKWDEGNDHLIMELNDYSDANFLKHYFYREYEKDAQTDNYILVSHSFPSATLSLTLSKRLNQFYSDIEKVPEIKLETTSFKVMDTPFYYQNQTSISGLTSRTAYTDVDGDTVRFDTYDRLSYPFKFAFLNLEPSVGIRNTYYSKDKNGEENISRSIFYSGCNLLTKFYRTFDVKVNSYGIEIDKLRHIITPSLEYSFINDPTLSSDRLTTFDEIDSITKQNTVTLTLENKLQTKRSGESVDFLVFIVKSPYDFKQDGNSGGEFGDLSFDLEMLPNSWLKFWSDAQFDFRRRSFRNANFDISFPLENDGKVTAGYRYAVGAEDKDSEVFTFGLERQLNPKWRFRCYHRLEFTASKMIEEQEYALSRDMHCWDLEFIVNSKKKKGVTFWFAFRLKAFSDVGFDFEKGHQQPKT